MRSTVFLALGALFVSGSALPGQLTQDAPPELFVPAVEQRPLYVSEMAVRQRNVSFERALLGASSRRAAPVLTVNLFPDVRVPAVLDRVEEAWGGGHVWVGHVATRPEEEVIFSVFEDALTGTVNYQDRLFQIHYRGGGVVTVTEADENRAPACATTDAHAVAKDPTPIPLGNAGRAASPDVDVMVVYTTKAKNANGGSTGMNSLINLGVTETNNGYSNSQVEQRIVLVHSAELVGYVENGNFGTELDRLTRTGDGWIDEIHGWRDTYGADIVTEIIASGSSCGIAWLMTHISLSFEDSAFNVVADGCFTGYYSFGHELGHNMGCAHDRQNASVGAHDYSYGYRTGGSPNYRTVLAYSPGSRVNRYSNPNITYGGKVMGIAYPSASSAENWRTLVNASNVVHRWRHDTSPTMKIPKLFQGVAATLKGENLTPGGDFYIAYSIHGGGPTQTAWGDANLTRPFVALGPATVDASGFAEIPITVPAGSQGTKVWFHGLDLGSFSLTNGMAKVID